jgi:hypothetical protein
MTGHTKDTKSAKFAEAIRVVHEFRAQYPPDRQRPPPMLPRISAWELLTKCDAKKKARANRFMAGSAPVRPGSTPR